MSVERDNACWYKETRRRTDIHRDSRRWSILLDHERGRKLDSRVKAMNMFGSSNEQKGPMDYTSHCHTVDEAVGLYVYSNRPRSARYVPKSNRSEL